MDDELESDPVSRFLPLGSLTGVVAGVLAALFRFPTLRFPYIPGVRGGTRGVLSDFMAVEGMEKVGKPPVDVDCSLDAICMRFDKFLTI